MSATPSGNGYQDGAREPVAIVGFSFGFGGDAVSADSFWSMITEGRTARSPIPSDRFNAAAFYHPDTTRLDRLPVKYGNFVTEDIAAFDAPFFSIQPAEAAAMDPQSRKLLETTYRAFENAGIPIEECANTKTCVFTGISSDNYRLMNVKDTSHPIRHAATGMATSMLANKISWFFDLKGPSVQLDTACSASLTALHLAVRSIQSGECTIGIVADINLYFTPESLAPLAHLNFFSPDARCYSFDHRANGYTRGEGYGVFVLKPQSQALLDGDPIRAAIKGTASNENGCTVGGITKVNLAAQQALIDSAYRDADPSLTRYVEAHAPGTEGDNVEATALASSFSRHRTKDSPLYMGPIKASVGHLEGASRMASLANVVLMLGKGVIPQLANFEKLHPKIHGEEWHIEFALENVPWPAGLRQASINSFDFGEANAHVVLEDGRKYTKLRQREPVSSQPVLLVFSAADKEGIKRLSDAMATHLQSKLTLGDLSIRNLAYTLAERRSRLPWKSAVVLPASDTVDTDPAVKLLETISEPIRSTQAPNIVLIFTGQGAAWAHMGLQFMYNKAFRDSMERSTAYLASFGGYWDSVEELSKPEAESRIHELLYAQYLCTTIQVAFVHMLQTFGITARYIVGHSSGEIAAAYATGAISARTALKIAYYRGWLIAREFSKPNVYGMLVVGLGESDMQSFMDENVGLVPDEEVHIPCINSPRNVTLSGKVDALQTLQGILQTSSIFVRMLSVPAPYHSPLLVSIAKQYEASLGHLDGSCQDGDMTAPTVEMISSVTGDLVPKATLGTASYWVRNFLSPVRFEPAQQRLMSLSSTAAPNERKPKPLCFLELGPYGALRTPIRDTLKTITLSYYIVMDKACSTAHRLSPRLARYIVSDINCPSTL